MIQHLTYPVDWNFRKRGNWIHWFGYYSPMNPDEVPYVLAWCENNFGERSYTVTQDDVWGYSGGYIWIRERELVDWFLLRWS